MHKASGWVGLSECYHTVHVLILSYQELRWSEFRPNFSQKLKGAFSHYGTEGDGLNTIQFLIYFWTPGSNGGEMK